MASPTPAVVFRFVRIEVVEDDVQLAIGIVGDDDVHEVEKFTAAPPRRSAPLVSCPSRGCSATANKVLVRGACMHD